MAKTKPTFEVQDTTEEHDAELERLYAGQKPVGKQDLYRVPAFTWLEMKELGHINRMVLLVEKFHPGEVVLTVVDVATGEGVWCEPEQIVAIGPKLSAPNAPLSNLFKTKASSSAREANSRRDKFRQEMMHEDPEYADTHADIMMNAAKSGRMSKRDKGYEKRKHTTFPWSATFKDNVKEIEINSRLYTDQQISRVVNRMVSETIRENSHSCFFVKESPGSIQRGVDEKGNLTIAYYLGERKDNEGNELAGRVCDESGDEILNLLGPIGLEAITPKRRSIVLEWMSRSDLLDE